jgi:hypothetical protein
MIKITVVFGSCNHYSVDIPETKEVGTLSVHLLAPIKKTNTDILYFILNGLLVGESTEDLDTQISEFGVPSKHYMAHFIFRDPQVTYSDAVLASSERINAWVRRHTAESASASASALSRLMGLQVNISNLVDEVVSIPEEEYQNYVTFVTELTDDNCSICAEPLGESYQGKIINCNHMFHAHCIHEHLVTQGSVRCPTCAQDVRGP